MKAKKSHSKAGKMGEMDGGREVEERDVSPDGARWGTEPTTLLQYRPGTWGSCMFVIVQLLPQTWQSRDYFSAGFSEAGVWLMAVHLNF